MGSRLNPASNIYMPMAAPPRYPYMPQIQHPIFPYGNYPGGYPHMQQQQQQQQQQQNQQLHNQQIHQHNQQIQQQAQAAQQHLQAQTAAQQLLQNHQQHYNNISNTANTNKEKDIPKTNTQYTNFEAGKNLDLASRYFSECTTKDFIGNKKKSNTVAWNLNGNKLACGGSDGFLRVWNFDNSTISNSSHNINNNSNNSTSNTNNNPSRNPCSNSKDLVEFKLREIDTTSGSSSSSSSSSSSQNNQSSSINVEQVSWSPKNNDIVAIVGSDKYIRIFDVKSGKNISLITGNAIIDIRWSPDGLFIISCTNDDHLSLIDTTSFKALKSYKFNGEELNQVGWDNNGEIILMANTAGNIECYKFLPKSTTHVKHLKTLYGHTASIYSMEFDPTGRYFATGSADSITSLWDINEMMCVKTFSHPISDQKAPSVPCRSISFSFDGQFIATSSYESTIDIYHVESGELIHKIECSGVSSLAWHPTLPLLAYAPETNENNKDPNIKVFGYHS